MIIIFGWLLVIVYLLLFLKPELFRLNMGTRSILYGAHAFWFHPFVVAAAWWKTYGFPFDPRLWVAFFVHDLGYIGCPNMDGPEGERHPELGASIMHMLFGRRGYKAGERAGCGPFAHAYYSAAIPADTHWHDFSLYHSRTYAKLHGAEVSKLCYADKLAFTVQPKWLYLTLVRLTGEYAEYLENARKYNASLGYTKIRVDSLSNWYDDLVKHFYCVIKPHDKAA
jgi:hypothetical protein